MSDRVEAFAQAAIAFCAHLEDPPPEPGRVQVLQKLLADLYRAALDLPESDPTDRTAPSVKRPPAAERVEGVEEYRCLSDPLSDSAIEVRAISEDLAGIYRDLQPGMALYNRNMGGDLGDAAWEWRFSFVDRWGDHLLTALRALHRSRVYSW